MIEDSTSTPTSWQRATHDWRDAYSSRLVVTDLLVLVWVIFGVQIAWFGFDSSNVAFRGNLGGLAISYTTISVVLVAAWSLMLTFYGTRGYRVIGTGSTEYKLIADASLRLFGLVAIVAFLFHIDIARGYVLIAFPLGLVFLMLSRWLWRQWLNVQRSHGSYSSQVLLVGSEQSVRHIARELNRNPGAGYQIVGACIPQVASSIPVLPAGGYVQHGFGDITELMNTRGADTVIITSSDEFPPDRVRELSWTLVPGEQHLVVAPSLTDVGGPRVHTRPVAGLPLIHVETPQYEGARAFTKRTYDIVLSSITLLLLSPVLAAVALAVKATSPGPVFYRSERVGYRGRAFKMLKFRSMRVGADRELSALLAAQGTSDKPLFKVADDPRITTVGRFLRRYSLDELPQLLNVLAGSMSLVGPRPQISAEVALYDETAHRRLLLKPGVSGLWQVSGRSNLPWEEAIRLDLYYVENWSITGDLAILWRTFKAVVGKDGAI